MLRRRVLRRRAREPPVACAPLTRGRWQGREAEEADLIDWANRTVQAAPVQHVRGALRAKRTMHSFNDPSLATGVFLMQLLAAIAPGAGVRAHACAAPSVTALLARGLWQGA